MPLRKLPIIGPYIKEICAQERDRIITWMGKRIDREENETLKMALIEMMEDLRNHEDED